MGLFCLQWMQVLYSDNLRLKIAPCDYTEDITLAQKTLEQICEFLLEYPEVKVLAGHELFIIYITNF